MNLDSEHQSQLPWTGERYVPEITGEIQLEHLHRYLLAGEYAKDKEVLDIACGEGFGAAILAKTARSVVGVDIAREAVQHASIRYRLENVKFLQGSCAEIPLDDKSIDLVVSFETIEHHDQHKAMMAEMKRVLRPEGVLIISTPDRKEYSVLPNYQNPFHVRELFKEEFEDLIRAHFKNLGLISQRIVYGSGILPETVAFRITDYDIKDTSCASRGLGRARYLIAVASDDALPVLSGGLLEQTIEESEIVQHYAAENEKHSERIAQLGDTIRQLEAQIQSQASQSVDSVRQLQSQASQSADSVRQLQEQLQSQASQSAGNVRQLQEQLQSQASQSAETVHLQEQLQSQASQFAETVHRLQEQLQSQESQSADTYRQLQEAAKTHQEAATQHDKTTLKLRQERASQAAALCELRDDLAKSRHQVTAVEQKLGQLKASLSWQVTSPLRLARDALAATVRRARRHRFKESAAAVARPGNPVRATIAGLFDQEYYARLNSGAMTSGSSPIEHYLECGWKEGLKPHPLFEPSWYLQANRDVADAGVEPLQHYLTNGWREGRSPHPLFDVRYYLSQAPELPEMGLEPVTHFLQQGARKGLKPNPLFDPLWYARFNLQAMSPEENALTHYVTRGWKEGCDPHPSFNISLYLLANPKVRSSNEDPLADYLRRSRTEPVQLMPDILPEPPSACLQPPETGVKAIALYLPQFHRIPENDTWWGEGFTEWTNVRRGEPQFWGHYQPHVPHPDLGYYDLLDPGIMEKQAQMAQQFGIHGFCYYYYWFHGRRLLEMPTDRLLASGKPDFPFCFCWANENWTRRWDGEEHEVLVEQQHSYQSDERFIQDILPALRHRRYIRINGRPLLAVYRPGSLPDPKATFVHWREFCRRAGLGEIYLAGFKTSFDLQDPEAMGLNGAVEFPPHHCEVTKTDREELSVFNNFCGAIYDYRKVAENLVTRPAGSHTLFRGVMPGWDNTARMQNQGTIWAHSNPQLYCRWLHRAVLQTRRRPNPDERLIFINAWNEWAEGAHLEPDERHGYALLNATRLALESGTYSREIALDSGQPYLLVISHDAAMAGAQVLLVNLLREWKKRHLVIRIVCVGDGELRGEFEACFPTLLLADYASKTEQEGALTDFLKGSPRAIYSSTVVNGPLLAELRPLGVKIVTHAHELQKSIERWAPGEIMAATLASSDFFLAGSAKVAENLSISHGVPKDHLEVVDDFIELWGEEQEPDAPTKDAMRGELGIDIEDVVVFGCGTTDWRKGPDLFFEIARLACPRDARLKFVWIGGEPGPFTKEVGSAGLQGRILFVGNRRKSRRYYYVGHIFLLSSREDPCPLVALEAADAGLPVVCFADAGDIPGFVGDDCGAAVPYEDVHSAAQAVARLASDAALRRAQGAAARRRVAERHSCASAALQIEALFDRLSDGSPATSGRAKRPAQESLVSVIVPNYNHEKYLPERLSSIREQTYQNVEIVLLDDASTDRSQEILQLFSSQESRARFIPNTQNSGSTFKQWRKGLRQARGKYVWLAESDDAAEPEFLETLVEKLESDPKLSLAYCQLEMVSADGQRLGTPEGPWLSEIDPLRWKNDFSNDGLDEIRRSLIVKNTILNASGVVFRNAAGIADLVEDSMRLCADWLFWVRLLQRGGVAYVARPLSRWRLQSSNARRLPPGELEWLEGERVLVEAAQILRLTPEDRDRILLDFLRKCWKWRLGASPREQELASKR
jgi:glycosyltransferase involved in cell wall biosynthesis/SAM-dependent methyltransferase